METSTIVDSISFGILLINFDESLNSLLEKGNYDYTGIERTLSGDIFKLNKSGIEEVAIFLLPVKKLPGGQKGMEPHQARRRLSKFGLEPSGTNFGAYPLLTYGAKCPEKPESGSIIDLGVAWRSNEEPGSKYSYFDHALDLSSAGNGCKRKMMAKVVGSNVASMFDKPPIGPEDVLIATKKSK